MSEDDSDLLEKLRRKLDKMERDYASSDEYFRRELMKRLKEALIRKVKDKFGSD